MYPEDTSNTWLNKSFSVSEPLAMPLILPLIQGFHTSNETTTVRRRRRRRECVHACTWSLCGDNDAASVGMATIGSSTLLLLLLLLSGPLDATALELGKSLRKIYDVGVLWIDLFCFRRYVWSSFWRSRFITVYKGYILKTEEGCLRV